MRLPLVDQYLAHRPPSPALAYMNDYVEVVSVGSSFFGTVLMDVVFIPLLYSLARVLSLDMMDMHVPLQTKDALRPTNTWDMRFENQVYTRQNHV